VRAAGVNASDLKKRRGLMDGERPQTMGHEAAGSSTSSVRALRM
jgi:Zn-dependent alcohol dehydrogenase